MRFIGHIVCFVVKIIIFKLQFIFPKMISMPQASIVLETKMKGIFLWIKKVILR